MRIARRAVQLLVIAAVAIVIGFLMGEAALRLLGITYPVFDTYDRDRAVALKPGKEGWYHGEGKAYLRINHLGYRDIEHASQKTNDVFRIAILGDSFAEARQVSIGETFWKLLESRLPARRGFFSGRKIEVLNFGIGGYGPTQELLTLKLHALKFSPDLVITAYCTGNDLASNSQKLSARVDRIFTPFYTLNNGSLELDNSFRDLNLKYLERRFLLSAIHYSRVLEVLNQARRAAALRRLQTASNSKPYEAGLYDEEFIEPRDSLWHDAWAVNEAVITEMNRVTLRGGGRFVLLVLSSPIQVDPDGTRREQLQRKLEATDLFYTERRLREVGQRLGFPVITVAEELQQDAARSGTYFHGFANSGLGTGHFNERGHEAVAEILVRELARLAGDW